MSLAETIAQVGGASAIEEVAKKFGLPANLASQAVGMMLPALSDGIARNAKKEGGVEALLGALSKGGHEKYLDQPESLASSSTAEDGKGILGHILGGKDASRGVATTVASVLGIENETVKSMLPMVAAMAMGGLSKQTKLAGLTKEGAAGSSTGDLLGQLGSMLNVKDAGDILAKLF